MKKIKKLKEIHKVYGWQGIINKFLRKLRLIEKHDYFLGEKLDKLENEIMKISNNLVLYGHYKDTYLSCKTNWKSQDNCSKLLGIYESQVQDKIIQEQKKNNLINIVNFGAADGYHILGLIKKGYFENGYAFEIDKITKNYLEENINKNNLDGKIKTFFEANFDIIFKNISDNDLKKTLFLIDIEGQEFELLNEIILKRLMHSYLLIENHDFIQPNKNLINLFQKNIEKFFNIEIIEYSSKNPFQINLLKNFSEIDKWLMMNEGRPQTMHWIYLTPKHK